LGDDPEPGRAVGRVGLVPEPASAGPADDVERVEFLAGVDDVALRLERGGLDEVARLDRPEAGQGLVADQHVPGLELPARAVAEETTDAVAVGAVLDIRVRADRAGRRQLLEL